MASSSYSSRKMKKSTSGSSVKRVKTVSVSSRTDSVTSLPHGKSDKWIEHVLKKRECSTFVPIARNSQRCYCGRLRSQHQVLPCTFTLNDLSLRWTVQNNTSIFPTDAYGTIEFQGGPHLNKAQYVRVAHDTDPREVLQLLQEQWGLDLPKLLISVHGGIANFDLQPKLKRVFRKGLMRAAKTTGAWIVTGGTNTGVMKHVGDALGDTLVQMRNNIITIGIAPWGVVHNRRGLIGSHKVTPYHAVASPRSNNVVLNSNHSYFLLVDNGTVGKFGCEIAFRKRLEKYIAQQKIITRSGRQNYSTPVVCLMLEGGCNTIRAALECVTDDPPVPLVVCDGSGRGSDLLAFTHKYASESGTIAENLRDQLILTIEKTFQYSRPQAEKVFIELMLCVKKRDLITVFRMGDGDQEIDMAILTALLKGQNSSAPDQLSLALTWNRVDIAQSQIFIYGQDWPEGSLEQAMLDALVSDRVDFVQLLLENGVNMHKWLTIARLEELYNIGLKATPTKNITSLQGIPQKQDCASTLRFLIRENKKHIPPGYHYTLYDIGQVMEKLMGGAYRASYCRRRFRSMYNAIMKKGHSVSHLLGEIHPNTSELEEQVFKYPFSELTVWAVLMRRQKLAMFFWKHGEEALAKALVACKLYKSMAHEAEQDDLEIDISQELEGFAKEFGQLAEELLQYCYDTDDDLTQQLLTYELDNWSDQTCLSLAVAASHRDFLANTCCQILLTEMWMGALRMRKYTSFKVILGIIVFPTVLFLEFKSKEELQLMPQTVEEHMEEMEDSDSECESDSQNESKDPTHISEGQAEAAQIDSTAKSNGNPFIQIRKDALDFNRKSSSLRVGKKIHEFYTAPVTKFWMHTIVYITFLMSFTYIVLIKTPLTPSLLEWLVISYVTGLASEKIREILESEPKKLRQKVFIHLSEAWNVSDFVAIIIFAVGVMLRLQPSMYAYGRVFYCVDIIFWFVRILNLFSVSKHLGPYVMMIGKMVTDMLSFIVILVIMLMAFGVLRQSITYPHEEAQWSLVRDVFLKPYFMLYGEVYAGEIDPECSDAEDSEFKCVPGRWIVPAVMSVYLIVCNILLINLLIAVFNNTFFQVNAISNQVWKFQRYRLVLEYESRPILPPPLIILCHIYRLIKYICRRCKGKREFYDNGLKLFLVDEDVERLHDFEEECLEGYFRTKEVRLMSSTDERIKETSERMENFALRLEDINQKENSLKIAFQTMDYRLGKLEDLAESTNTLLCQILRSLPHASQTTDPNLPPSLTSLPAPASTRNLLSRRPSHGRAFREDRLRPFTDYSNRPRNLALHRAYSLDTPSPRGKDSVDGKMRQIKKNVRNVHNPVFSPSTSESPMEEDEITPSTSKSIHKMKPSDMRSADLREKFKNFLAQDSISEKGEVPDIAGGRSVLMEPVSAPANVQQPWFHPGTTQSLELSQCEGSSMDLCSPQLPPTHILPITPIITPTRTEYTSITDDIDTSCANHRSPPGSPQTPHVHRHFTFDAPAKPSPLARPQKPSKVSFQAHTKLKSVEESEHKLMESVILKRMRKISLTESDSLVDIAKHVIDMEQSEKELSPPTSCYSDDEETSTTQASKLSPTKRCFLKNVKSEPSFVDLSHKAPHEIEGAEVAADDRDEEDRSPLLKKTQEETGTKTGHSTVC